MESKGRRFNPYKIFLGAFIPNIILINPKLSNLSKIVYGRLMQYSGENGKAYPKVDTLSKEVGRSPEQTRGAIKELESGGLIEIERPFGRDRLTHKPNVYHFLWPDEWNEIDEIAKEGSETFEIKGSGHFETEGSNSNRFIIKKNESMIHSVSDDTTIKTDQEKPPERKLHKLLPELTRRESMKVKAEIENYANQKPEPQAKPTDAVSLLIEHWQSLGLKETNPEKAPKTHNDNIRYLKRALKGSLIPNQPALTSEQIMDSMTKFSLAALDPMFSPSKPEYKKKLASMHIKRFCYNPHSNGNGCNSMLVKYLSDEPLKEVANGDAKIEDPDPQTTARIRRFYVNYVLGGAKAKLSPKDESNFRKTTKMLIDFRRENRGKIMASGSECDMVNLLKEAIRDCYEENVSKVYSSTLCSAFALGRLVAKMNEEGLIAE